jgi:hypothetical protein
MARDRRGLSIIQGIVGAAAFGYRGPMFGPSDVLFIIFTGFSVYILLVFRSLLNERYDFHEIDALIIASIAWAVLFQIASLTLRTFLVLTWPVSQTAMTIVYFAFMSLTMVTIGVIDILIGVRLLRVKDKFNDMLKAFAYVTLAAGILEVTVFLSPLSLILVPMSMVILGLLLLREKEEAEFV